jgi:hypothetical protein
VTSSTAASVRVGRVVGAGVVALVLRGVPVDDGTVAMPVARAGEQLSTAELFRRADAIAVVDNTLDGQGRATSWLKPPPAGRAVGALAGVCVPNRALLQQWQAGHKTHPGRATWAASLAAGHVEQVVFVKDDRGTLEPVCETEVMLGRSFALHPDYPAFRAELDALLAPVAPPAPPASTVPTSVVPPPVVTPPVVPAPVVTPPPPPPSSGCL